MLIPKKPAEMVIDPPAEEGNMTEGSPKAPQGASRDGKLSHGVAKTGNLLGFCWMCIRVNSQKKHGVGFSPSGPERKKIL